MANFSKKKNKSWVAYTRNVRFLTLIMEKKYFSEIFAFLGILAHFWAKNSKKWPIFRKIKVGLLILKMFVF